MDGFGLNRSARVVDVRFATAHREPVMSETNGQAGPLHSEFADDAEMMELVREYVDQLRVRVEELRSCWEEERLTDLQQLAHQIKGAAGGYGFGPIGDAAGRIEKRLKLGASEVSALREEFEELIELCSRAMA